MITQLATLLVTLFFVFTSAHPGSGIAVDEQGRVFFAAGSVIVMVETNRQARTIVHDSRQERFYQLHHIHRSPKGAAWLTASDRGDVLWQFTPNGELTRFFPLDGNPSPAEIGSGGDPFAVDADGNIYVVKSAPNLSTQVLRINSSGKTNLVAGGRWGYLDGNGANARFEDLHGGSMIIAKDRSLLLTDSGIRVRKITRDGNVSTLAGGPIPGYQDGPSLNARFESARGLALDHNSTLFIAESSGRIRSLSQAGTVSTFAGAAGRGHKDGPVNEALFTEPSGIAAATNGDLFILEPSEYRVRKISAGIVTTFHAGLPPVK